MPAAAVSISDTTTPMMVERAAQPQAREHGRDRRRDDHACDLLRQGRAHAARGQQELRVDGADARRGREHHREEAVDAGEGDLRLRADAEPGGEDRIEDHDRHRVEAGEHRQQQVAQQREPAHQRADQDAAAAGDGHRERHLVERHQQRREVDRASPAPARSSVFDSAGRNSSGMTPVRGTSSHSARSTTRIEPADGGGRGSSHARPHQSVFRICCQMRSRRRPNTSVAIIS